MISFTSLFLVAIISASLSSDSQPVSYTHLDVYKRQGWERIFSSRKQTRRPRDVAQFIKENPGRETFKKNDG